MLTEKVSKTSISPTAPEFLFIPRTLSQCRKGMKERAAACIKDPTFENCVEACSICRSALAAYLLEWILHRNNRYREEMEAGMERCQEAVSQAAKALHGRQRELANHYVDNIGFRLELIKVLHGENGYENAWKLLSRAINEQLSAI